MQTRLMTKVRGTQEASQLADSWYDIQDNNHSRQLCTMGHLR
jgi:hypothetical protein